MTTLTSLLVSAHQDELLAQAAADRLARTSRVQKVASPNRVASAVKSVWSTLSGPAERPTTPTLVNYPFINSPFRG